MEPHGTGHGVGPGEERPSLLMRPVFCLVRSCAPGDRQYNTLEGKTTKRVVNLDSSGRQAFAHFAPSLVERELELLELEEVGFVETDSVKEMRKRGFHDALFVTDEQLDEPLGLTLGESTGELIFHTLRRSSAHLLPPPVMLLEQHHHQPGDGGCGDGPSEEHRREPKRTKRTATRHF
jgi:hypothetical protein